MFPFVLRCARAVWVAADTAFCFVAFIVLVVVAGVVELVEPLRRS